jgi:hypothetical protein
MRVTEWRIAGETERVKRELINRRVREIVSLLGNDREREAGVNVLVSVE